MVKVVPAFTGFYGTFGAELPLATRDPDGDLERAAGQPASWIGVVVVGVGVFVWSWLQIARQRGPAARRDPAPARRSARVATQFATSQFARTLATLLGGGIPLVSALEVAGRAVGNRYVGAGSRDDDPAGARGQSLGQAMAERGVFPDVALKMVDVGEQTGALQEMLNAVADFFDESVETTLARFTRLIEPLMLVIMAVVIAADPAGALPAGVPAVVGGGLSDEETHATWTDHDRRRCSDPQAALDAAGRRRVVLSNPAQRGAEVAQARRLAERYKLEFVDMAQFHIDSQLFRIDPRRADAALRLRAGAARRATRSSSSSPTRPTCR